MSVSADSSNAVTKKKKKKIRNSKDDSTTPAIASPSDTAAASAPTKKRVKVKKSTDDAKSPRSSKSGTVAATISDDNEAAAHIIAAAPAAATTATKIAKRHVHASSTASDDSGGEVSSLLASPVAASTATSGKKSRHKASSPAIDVPGSSSSSPTTTGSFSVKRHVKKVLGFGSFLSGARASKAEHGGEQRADPSIDMGVVNEMLDELGDDRGARVSRSPPTESPSPFISSEDAASGPYRSAKAQLVSMQVEDTDEIDVPGLHRRSSSARYELLRQRSQVVNQQYEGAKRQLQRLVSDSSMRSSDADEFTAAELSPPLSPSSEVSGSPTKSSMMSAQQQRGAMRRSGSVNAESPTLPRMRRQQRQAILAPTRVAPTPALVVPIATRQAARDDPTAIVPPQYTLAPLVLPPKQPADSAVEAREATTTAFLACMDEMGRVRDKVNVATKAADSHVREVSRELSTEHRNNAAQLREVDSKLDKSETVLRAVRDSIQKLENRIQVVKRAQRNANVALKAGQLLPVLGLIALCVYSLRLVFSLV